jgi:phenylacetate-CoA ligase
LKNKQAILILKGRNDVSVTFYALNIYPENIKAGLEDDSLKDIVTGKYVAKVQHSKNFVDQKLVIEVELQENVEPTDMHVLLVKNSISNSLIHLNAEYRKLLASIQEKAILKLY